MLIFCFVLIDSFRKLWTISMHHEVINSFLEVPVKTGEGLLYIDHGSRSSSESDVKLAVDFCGTYGCHIFILLGVILTGSRRI